MERLMRWRTGSRTIESRWMMGLVVGLVIVGAFAVSGAASGASRAGGAGGQLGKAVWVMDRMNVQTSTDSETGSFAIESFSWGVTPSGTVGGGGGGGEGKATFHDLSFTKRLDKNSPM